MYIYIYEQMYMCSTFTNNNCVCMVYIYIYAVSVKYWLNTYKCNIHVYIHMYRSGAWFAIYIGRLVPKRCWGIRFMIVCVMDPIRCSSDTHILACLHMPRTGGEKFTSRAPNLFLGGLLSSHNCVHRLLTWVKLHFSEAINTCNS